jgi:hypothetical protein
MSLAVRLTLSALASGFLAVSVGCRERDSRDVSRRTPAMVLVEPAEELQYFDNYDPSGQPELEMIRYRVTAAYPAREVICRVTRDLATSGWRPLKRVMDDNGTPSSFMNGWRVINSRKGRPDEHHVDLWDAAWTNDLGDLLSYSLTYRYPAAGPVDRSRLGVGAIRTPAATIGERERSRIDSAGIVAADESPRLTEHESANCEAGSQPGQR